MASLASPKTKSKRLWTYDEMLAELPESTQPLELWDGEIVMSARSPHAERQRLVLRVCE